MTIPYGWLTDTIVVRDVRCLAIGLIVGVLGVLEAQHLTDSQRDAALERLHGKITADSTTRVAAVARTDTAIARADTAVRATARATVDWETARRAADRVPGIVVASMPDTAKIRELVATVDTLHVAGDSLERVATADTVVIATLRTAFSAERATWSTENRDLRTALAVSESEHRHWGLGCSGGYGVVRDGEGNAKVGPAIACGVTYRW